MRKITLLIAVFAFCISASGQDPVNFSENRHEVNIGFFNVFNMNAVHDFGVGYKLSGERGALRVATGFNLNTADRDGEDYQFNEKEFAFSPRIGYEFHQQFKRLRLYYGADMVASFYKAVYEETFPVFDPNETETNTRKTNQVGIRPTLGLTVFLSKSVSLSTETYLNVMYYKSIFEQENPDATTTTKGINVGLGPLGIVSLNFHF